MSSIDLRRVLFLVFALLLGAAAVMVYRMPVQRYVVACERTTQVACTLEQATNTETRRWNVALGADATANVRLMPQRRGGPRVLLYLTSAAGAIFAAEFEGGDAVITAEAAAAQLNQVLRASTPGSTRVVAAPPSLFRWAAWGMLAVMGLLIIAGYRNVSSSEKASRTA